MLRVLFTGYTDFPPTCFVFCGNFLSSPQGADHTKILKGNTLIVMSSVDSWFATEIDWIVFLCLAWYIDKTKLYFNCLTGRTYIFYMNIDRYQVKIDT